LSDAATRRARGLHLVYAQLWAVKRVADVAERLLRAVATMQVRESTLLQRVARALGQGRVRAAVPGGRWKLGQ